MKRPSVLDVLPLTEFRNHMAELVERMNKTRSPIVLTQHGRTVGVVMPPAEYEELAYREEFIAAVQEGIDELDAGKSIPHEEVMAHLKARRDAWVQAEIAAGREPNRGADMSLEAAIARADGRKAAARSRKQSKAQSKKGSRR